MAMSLSYPTDIPFCLTPVSADERSPALSPLPLWKRTPVRLESSLPAITAVVQAVVAHRVSQGDALLAEATLARCNDAYDLTSAGLASPAPHASVKGFERAYYDAQFTAALSPAHDVSHPFACHPLPDISVPAYVARLLSMTHSVSNGAYLLAVMLLDRARLLHPGLFLRTSTAHRMLLAAFAVAAKSHEDDYVPNIEFARVGGVPLHELNRLEAAFLSLINWRTHFSAEEFIAFESEIVVEALDAPHGLAVFQALRARNVSGLDAAVRATSTWALPAPPLSPLADVSDPAWTAGGWGNAQASRLRRARGPAGAVAIVAGIAAAVCRFNFPDVPTQAPGLIYKLQQRFRMGAYSQRPLMHARLIALMSIVDGESLGTLAPSMLPVFAFPSNALFNAGGSTFGGGKPAEHCAAKASVHYLLNDIDPFEGLPRAPPGFGQRCDQPMSNADSFTLPASRFSMSGPGASMLAMERECGLEGLLQ